MTLLAAAGRVDITPAVGTVLGGYGARTAPSAGVLDPLLARFAVFDDGSGASAALVVCDLLGVHRRLVDAVRAAITAPSLPMERVIVAATHTHAGPMAAVRPADDPDWVAASARRIAAALDEACGRLEPVVLKASSVDVRTIGRNRRDPDGPCTTDLDVVVAEDAATGRPVATLLHHAVHATVMEADNLRMSADFPGAACRAVERAVGGVAVYVQGACADVNPVWMAHDRQEVERVGGIVGLAAARAVHELRPVGEGQWVINLSWSEEVPVAPDRGQVLGAGPVRGHRAVIEVERRAMPSAAEIDDLEAAQTAIVADGSRALDERRAARAHLNRLAMERVYGQWAPAEKGHQHKAEVQAITIGADLALVGLPGEFFTETGVDIARRSPFPRTLVVGYANHYLGYVPPPAAFDHDGYEVGCAQFTQVAAGAFADAAVDLLGTPA